jgi:hypothetical protein
VNGSLGSLRGGAGGRRRVRSGVSATVLVVLFMLSFAGAAVGSPSALSIVRADVFGAPDAVATSTESASTGVLTSCSVAQVAWTDAYDPADGYVYAAGGNGISILKPPCTVVKTVIPPGYAEVGLYAPAFPGTAYDPITKEIVVTGATVGFAWVLQGTSLVETVWLGGTYGNICPGFEAWDPSTDALLIADDGGSGCEGGDGPGGVIVLHLSIVDGVTQASVVISAFDRGDFATDVLVADGYIFTAGNGVKVFNDRTFAYLGKFADGGYGASQLDILSTLAWDPLNETVVLGLGDYYPGEGMGAGGSVHFLNTEGVKSGKFTSSDFPTDGILYGGVGGVRYSPATHDVYLTAYSGPEVWELSGTGELTHVFLGTGAGELGLTYDPLNHDMYVCGYNELNGYGEMYVIH